MMGIPFEQINFYTSPPLDGCIDLPSLRECAVARLQVLRKIDNLCAADLSVGAVAKHVKQVSDELAAHGLQHSPGRPRGQVERRDLVSHFMLRLAFALDRDSAAWFVKQECRLLLARLKRNSDMLDKSSFKEAGMNSFSSGKSAYISAVLEREGLQYARIDRDEENEALFKDITSCGPDPDKSISAVFRVPCFPDAEGLVRSRRCFVAAGFAHVPLPDLDGVLSNRLKSVLLESLSLARNREALLQQVLYDDDRIGPFIRRLRQSYQGPDFAKPTFDSSGTSRLTLHTINQMATRCFPLCMRRIYFTMKTEGHAKHWARLQLWMFLKGCGMTVDEQLLLGANLWKDKAAFEKEHRYNIRHAYGLEGKRADYAPYPCSRIIMSLPHPGPGEVHGCPFKTFDRGNLQKLLAGEVPPRLLPSIVELAAQHHPTLACVEHFKAVHAQQDADAVGNHPNAFYAAAARHEELQ